MSEPRESVEQMEEELLLRVLAARDRGEEPDLELLAAELPEERRRSFQQRAASLGRLQGALGRRDAACREPTFPGYRIEREIGEGALGVVFEAYDETLERRVALKVLRRGTGENILKEARRAAGLVDPAIVTVHSIAEGADASAIVMELVEGLPIDQAAAPLSIRQKARLLARVAGGLAVAHDNGIVHRDLKPDNILVAADHKPKLLDFGLALLEGRDSASRDHFEGTPLYASPEQVRGQPITSASDIFSFGSIMFQVLTGAPPFDADEVEEVFARITGEDPPFPRQLKGEVPEGLQSICLASLARDPADRPSAGEIATDLHRFLAGDAVRLRPSLYRDILHSQVSRQMGDLEVWQQQGMISGVEGDRVRTVLRRILADEDHWILDARRLSLPQMLLNTGIWLVVVAVALLVWLGRDELSADARWLIPNIGFLVLGLSGVLLHLRRQPEISAVLFAGAVLAAVPAVLSLLTEQGLLSARPEDVTQLLPEPFANQQLLLSCGGTLLLSLAALLLIRSTALAWTTATLLVATWFCFLFTLGFLDREAEIQALWCLPLLLLILPALYLERLRRVRWALPYHLVALLTLVIAPDVIAESGTTLQMLGILPGLDESRSEGYSFALNGLLLLLLMALFERTASLDLRRGARILEILAPLHLLGSLYGLAVRNEAPGIDVAIYLGGVLFFLLIGPWRNHRRLLLAGMLGLALGSHLLIDGGWVRPVPFLFWLGGVGFLVAWLTWRRVGR